ncbi:uncharacterized protein LOC109846944 [Asparagus officinalis]|uniref:uncharacterized protein LOC109846944 n=1 Tax=Asparagus officinalis TaxID=4686 RepID=UPI00098DED5A|nr:uncharacterized protein LOC109846944 [Asparagus officinalis]
MAARREEEEEHEEVRVTVSEGLGFGEMNEMATGYYAGEKERDSKRWVERAASERIKDLKVAESPIYQDDKEIERMVLEKKKMELLNKYTSDMLIEEQSEAKDMLNIKR